MRVRTMKSELPRQATVGLRHLAALVFMTAAGCGLQRDSWETAEPPGVGRPDNPYRMIEDDRVHPVLSCVTQEVIRLLDRQPWVSISESQAARLADLKPDDFHGDRPYLVRGVYVTGSWGGSAGVGTFTAEVHDGDVRVTYTIVDPLCRFPPGRWPLVVLLKSPPTGLFVVIHRPAMTNTARGVPVSGRDDVKSETR